MEIKEGQKVVIYNLSHCTQSKVIKADSEFELHENTLIIDNGYLCCVEHIKTSQHGIIVVEVYEQDAVVVKDGYIYKTMSDTY